MEYKDKNQYRDAIHDSFLSAAQVIVQTNSYEQNAQQHQSRQNCDHAQDLTHSNKINSLSSDIFHRACIFDVSPIWCAVAVNGRLVEGNIPFDGIIYSSAFDHSRISGYSAAFDDKLSVVYNTSAGIIGKIPRDTAALKYQSTSVIDAASIR